MQNILVVEDDYDLNQAICYSLKKSGYGVYGVTFIVPGSGLQLLTGVIIGASYYILSNYLLKTMEWKELILIVKRK